ncbi:formyltransferase family protein [Halobellus marinus]|uniref:formyltransferase family protein n=1 Tax=Halobellus TaxID=1073986 RepID=UPI0028AE8277|nr:formyltransferase family protein [Halobellus sp. DFY28]
MSKEIVILTRGALRHSFIRKLFGLAEGIDVLRTYCETGVEHTSGSELLEEARKNKEAVRINHLERRAQSEHDYFGPFVNITPDYSSPVDIPGGHINERQYYEEITSLNPDLLVSYGCSLVKDPLLNEYEGRFLNVHLGLSPYNRGRGSNFWPLVNRKPEYVGATFMHIDEGIDTGEIIHQLRARVHPDDGPHDIGNRLISDVGQVYPELVRSFEDLHSIDQPPEPEEENYHTSDDYNPEATKQLYENFDDGMISEYLSKLDSRISDVPIVKHPEIDEEKLIIEPEV